MKRKRGDSVSDDQAEDISLPQRCIRSTDFSTALTDALMHGPPHVSTQHTHAHTHTACVTLTFSQAIRLVCELLESWFEVSKSSASDGSVWFRFVQMHMPPMIVML